jgi:hypothetical protein
LEEPRAGTGARRRRERGGLLVAAALAALALAPLLGRGYVLVYDMVFVPRMQLSRELLGLGDAVARAVPSDLLVALASRAVPADVLQKLLLAAVFVGGGWGAARLAPAATAAGGAAAAALYVWNAGVYERLLMGHWALLLSYAALPWVVSAAIAWRGGRRRVHGLVAGLAVAAMGSPPGGVIAAGTALLVVAWPHGRRARGSGVAADLGSGAAPDPAPRSAPWRRAAVVVAAGLLVNAPWLLPSVLRPGGVPVRPVGAAAFASRPDGPLGTAGSLLGLGGIWNARVVPPGHGSWLWLPGFAAVVAVAVLGWLALPRRWPPGAAAGLLAAAAAGLVLALAYSVPGLRTLVELTVQHVPGGGLVRDAQKFVAPLALVEAVGFGVGVERLLAGAGGRRARAALGPALVAAPVLLLPALAWGAGGRLAAVAYPREWAEARALMAADPVPGTMLVLPWHLYLAFPWNGERVVLDPAQRYFTRRAVGNDDLELAGVTVPGEDPAGARLAPLVNGPAPLGPRLGAEGVRYVLVLKLAGWAGYTPRLAGLARVMDSRELSLYRVPDPAAVRSRGAPAAPVLLADALALATLVWALAGLPVAHHARQLLSSRQSGEGNR